MVLLAVAFLAITVGIFNVSGAPNHHPHHDHHPNGHHHDEMREKVYQLMCGNEEFSRGVKTCLDGITNEKAKAVMGTCSMVKGHNETKNSEDLIKALCTDPKYAEEVHKCTALLFPLINCTSDPSEIHPHNDNCHLDDDDDHDHDDNDDDGDDSDDDRDDSDDGSDDDDNSDDDYDDDDHDQDEDRSDNKHKNKYHKHNHHHHHHHHHAPHRHPGPYGHDFGANQECFNNLYEKFNLTSSIGDDE